MGKRVIKIHLDEDTARFLELARAEGTPESLNDFMNSLLRQESFRKGFPLGGGPGVDPPKPISSLTEKRMLMRSGLLPKPPSRRH